MIPVRSQWGPYNLLAMIQDDRWFLQTKSPQAALETRGSVPWRNAYWGVDRKNGRRSQMNVGSGTKQNANVYHMYILLYNIVYITIYIIVYILYILYYYKHIYIILLYIYILLEIYVYIIRCVYIYIIIYSDVLPTKNWAHRTLCSNKHVVYDNLTNIHKIGMLPNNPKPTEKKISLQSGAP